MAKSETIVQIAEAAGVSATTVSMVINGKADKYRISKKTQEKVQSVIANSSFQPNQHARSLRTNKTMTLGLIVADLSTHYFSNIAKTAERHARKQGYQLLIVDSDNNPDNERTLVEQLHLRGVDGIIVATTQSRWSNGFDGPVVFLDRGTNAQQSVVATNNRDATYDLVSALIKAELIDDNVRYIGGDTNITTAQERWQGFADALKDNGINPRTIVRYDGSFSSEWGSEAMQAIHDSGFKNGAIFMGAQMLTEGVLSWWQDQGLSIPEGITLCAFDDHPFLNYLNVPVSTVEQDIHGLATAAVDQVIQHIQDENKKSEQHIVPARLHIRHGGE